MVENSKDDALLQIEHIRANSNETTYERVETADAMRTALNAMKSGQLNKQWDIVLCDYLLSGFGAEAALQLLQESEVDLPFIVVASQLTADTLVRIMKAGCHDYVMKDDMTRLSYVIERSLADASLRLEKKNLHKALQDSEQRFRAIADFTYDWESWLSTKNILNWVKTLYVRNP